MPDRDRLERLIEIAGMRNLNISTLLSLLMLAGLLLLGGM